jgi:hypothetical protein
MAKRERIPVVIVEDYDEIARQIAARIAEIVRETQPGGPRGGARAGHREHADRDLPRADPHAPGGGARLLQRGDVQPGRVLPDGAGQHPQLPPVHVGEPLRAHQHRPENVHIPPGTCRATEVEERAPLRGGDPLAAAGSTSRSWGSGRRGTSASTSRAPAWSRAPGWWRWTPSPGATPPPTSSARTTCPPRRSPWAWRASWTRGRSR